MDLQHAVGIALRIVIATMVVAIGLGTTTSDLAYVVRRPALLARSLLATVVISPLVAIALWRVLRPEPEVAVALVCAALAPGMPSVPRTGGNIGANAAFACGIVVINSVIAVGAVPAWLLVVSRVAGFEITVEPSAVARILVLGILLPLGVGLATRRLAPALASKLVGPVGAFSSSLLPGLALVVALVGAATLRGLSWSALAAMVIAPVVALAVGHALGGPDPRDRTVLALANATRFPALAILVAQTSFPELPVMPATVAYLLVALAVAAPYARARKRAHSPPPREEPLPRDLATGAT